MAFIFSFLKLCRHPLRGPRVRNIRGVFGDRLLIFARIAGPDFKFYDDVAPPSAPILRAPKSEVVAGKHEFRTPGKSSRIIDSKSRRILDDGHSDKNDRNG